MKLLSSSRLLGRIIISNVRELSFPYRITFAVTSRCQARCTMCNIWQKPADNELTTTEIDTIFAKAKRLSWINLTGGELFQRPDILDIFSSAIKRSRDLYILNFPTNGIQTDEIVTAVDWILQKTRLPRLIVSVSIDGPPELHDQIRGIPGCWELATATFRSLQSRQSSRFSVYLGHTIQSANLGHLDECVAACKKVLPNITLDDFHVNLAHFSGHYYDNADRDALPDKKNAAHTLATISAQRTRKMFDPVSFIEHRYQKYAQYYLKTGNTPLVCQAAGASCFIDPSGTVYPCSVFDDPVGNLRDHALDLCELWQSTGHQQIRKKVIRGACPGCWTPCEAYQTILANLIKGKPAS